MKPAPASDVTEMSAATAEKPPLLGSLRKRRHPLAPPAAQRAALAAVPIAHHFAETVGLAGLDPLRAARVEVLQLNVGKRCNQTCRHCHVDAGPDRPEVMPDEVLEAALAFLAGTAIATLDITGGAPELHPRFREIVQRARALGRHVIDRANLTALLLPNYEDLPGFLAEQRVEIVASLPYFLARQTDAQRGAGVFDASIEALRRLNALGYGQEGSGLELQLVLNPVGAFLPPEQAAAERDWKRQLDRRYGIHFNHLYALTNMPIGRYLEYLGDSGNLDDYLHLLTTSFNAATVPGLMCRTTLSVGWDGRLYDCDFNQMLEIDCDGAAPQTIFEAELEAIEGRPIRVGPHCFGCTAGAGSSCGGSLS